MLTVNLCLNETGHNEQSTGVEDSVGEALLVPEELVGVDDLATLDPDGVVLDNLVVAQDLAVGNLDHLWLILGDGCVRLGGGGGGEGLSLEGDGVLHDYEIYTTVSTEGRGWKGRSDVRSGKVDEGGGG